jgi:arginase
LSKVEPISAAGWSWAAIGAPLDSAAAGEGEERAPAALRKAGLLARLGAADLGDVDPLHPPERHPRSGILAFESLVESSEAIADKVAEAIGSGRRPLVLGGDCSMLIGAIAGARQAGLRPGLLFVDGHADYWDGESSPTGEAADMELSILHGQGPPELAGMAPRPLVDPSRTVILGHRPPGLDEDVATERDRVPQEVLQLDAPAIRAGGPAEAAGRAAERAGADPWLHIDLDVLDEVELPAVSYPLAEGLTWEQLEGLLGPMVATGVCGVSVADLNSDLDPEGIHAAHVSELLGRLLAGGAAGPSLGS